MIFRARSAVYRCTATMIVLGGACCSDVDERCLAAPRSDGQLTIEVVDSETAQPIAVRMRLKNSRGRPVPMRLPDSAEFGGHFYFDGSVTLPLRAGQYTFELDAGPEYRTQSGHFEIERHAEDTERVEMKRFANMAEEGWYAGDLDIARRMDDLPLIARAERLHVLPAQSVERRQRPPSRKGSTHADTAIGPFARLIESPGGDLLRFGTSDPSDAGADDSESRFVVRTPYVWNLPCWLASGECDAIQLIHHHALEDGTLDHEKDGRPRDKRFFPGLTGNGRWSESVYYHVLNCGLRIPPAAGSGSGGNQNSVGTNRVYTFCGDDFSYDRWWDALANGRVVVTNGPLLRPTVEGQPPGYVFRFEGQASLSLEIGLNLATRVPVEYLQIIKNGEVAAEVRLADWVKRKGQLPPLEFTDSGWFLVRAVTNETRKYQFASSGPYYVEKTSPRVSRRSVQFFLDWIEAANVRASKLDGLDDDTRTALLAEHQNAREFFERLLTTANAE